MPSNKPGHPFGYTGHSREDLEATVRLLKLPWRTELLKAYDTRNLSKVAKLVDFRVKSDGVWGILLTAKTTFLTWDEQKELHGELPTRVGLWATYEFEPVWKDA